MVFVLGISGGPCSGKTYVCDYIKRKMNEVVSPRTFRVIVLHQEFFYREMSEAEQTMAKEHQYNFDHPDSFDYEFMADAITRLKMGGKVNLNYYNFKENKFTQQFEVDSSNIDLIIVEGILLFTDTKVRDLLDLKVFLLADKEKSLCNRVLRDLSIMGRDIDESLHYYHRFAKPSYIKYCQPFMEHSNIILHSEKTEVGLKVVIEHITEILGLGSSAEPQTNGRVAEECT